MNVGDEKGTVSKVVGSEKRKSFSWVVSVEDDSVVIETDPDGAVGDEVSSLLAEVEKSVKVDGISVPVYLM